MLVPVSPTSAPGTASQSQDVSSVANGDANPGPFAALLAVAGVDQTVAKRAEQSVESASLPEAAMGEDAAATSPDIIADTSDKDQVEAALQATLTQLEAGLPADPADLDLLAETGVIGPDMLSRLVSNDPVSPDTPTLRTDPGGALPRNDPAQTAQPQGPAANSVRPLAPQTLAEGAVSAASQQMTHRNSAPFTPVMPPLAPENTSNATASQQTGLPGQANLTGSLPVGAATSPKVAADGAPLGAPAGTADGVHDTAQGTIQPANASQRRSLGPQAPTGFLESLAAGETRMSGSETAQRDTLATLRAALHSQPGETAATPSAQAMVPDTMALADSGTGALPDFDLQFGSGRSLDALSQGGTPKTVTVTSNGTALPTQQLALTIATEARAGTRRFEIRLDPPEMGRIDVRLETNRDGQLRSMLTVERADTFEALSKDIRQIERILQASGLKLDEGGVQLAMGDSQSGSRSFANLFDDRRGERNGVATRRDEETAETGDGAIPPAAMTATDGTIDIRV